MLRVLMSGASGLIGSAVVRALERRGDEAVRLVRRPAQGRNEVQWDPMHEIPSTLVSGFDAVVHLAGESIGGRWTVEKKRRIRETRVISTQNLSQALAQAAKPAQIFLCASATGYYGNRGDEVLTEESSRGAGFLADVCQEWEVATQAAMRAGIRVANLRFGIVLSRNGGALRLILPPFRLGLGGRIGSGRQWWSWIHIEDVVGAMLDVLHGRNDISGPVNVVSPNPVRNVEFTRALAQVLRRPAALPLPAFAAKLAFGELAEEGMLASGRVMPKKLNESGFEFRHPEITAAFADILR